MAMTRTLTILACLLLFAGCATTPSKPVVTAPLPPMPTAARFVESAAPAPETPPPVVIVRWQNANAQPVSFDVFSGAEPDVDAMTLRVNTTNLFAEFPADQSQEYFTVRARRGDQVSAWGTR